MSSVGMCRRVSAVARFRIFLALFCLLCALNSGFGMEFMPVDQIRVGMKGTGKSVFKGTKIEEFQIEVLGIMPRSYAGHDMILVRCSGANLEHTGVIAGMSGSPVYIDGRMIGAVAMTYGFQKDPIAEVTPIADMVDIMKRTDQPDEGFLPQPKGGPRMANTGAELRPIPFPVSVSGLDNRMCAALSPAFDQFGLKLMAGGAEAGGTETSAATELEPGAAVGVCLIRGDMNASAIGTLTYREGNRIVAFGHPMYLGGPINLPMVGGVIHHILASQELSFKIFSPTAPVGAMTQDRANGVAGTIGQHVPMFPVSISVRSDGPERRYRYEVINHRLLTSSLVSMTVANAIISREQTSFPFTARAVFSVKLRGYPAVINRRWFTGNGAAGVIPSEVSDVLQYLMTNEFEKTDVESVSVRLDITPGTNLLNVTRAAVDRKQVRPGENVRLTVTLTPWRGKARTETVELAIPRETPEGILQVLVTTPDSALIAAVTAAGEAGRPRSLGQMIRLMERIGDENQLVIQGYIRKPGAYVDGAEYPNLPPSMLSLLNREPGNDARGRMETSLLFEKRLPLEQIVAGSQSLDIRIER